MSPTCYFLCCTLFVQCFNIYIVYEKYMILVYTTCLLHTSIHKVPPSYILLRIKNILVYILKNIHREIYTISCISIWSVFPVVLSCLINQFVVLSNYAVFYLSLPFFPLYRTSNSQFHKSVVAHSAYVTKKELAFSFLYGHIPLNHLIENSVNLAYCICFIRTNHKIKIGQ